MILFTILTQVYSLDTSSCQVLTCSNGPSRENCIESKDGGIFISPCVYGLKCDTTSLNTETDEWPTVACVEDTIEPDLCEDVYKELYTGQKCCVSSNCVSYQCTNDRCEGTEEGGECDKDEECAPNFYCNEVCIPAVTENCKTDNMCHVGFGCLNSKCVQLHTLDNGAESDRKFFCKSNFAYSGKCDVIEAYIDGVHLGDELSCVIGQECEYYTGNDHTFIEKGLCMCNGDGDTDSGYCGKYADKSSQIMKYYEAIIYDTSKCSGYLAGSDDLNVLYDCGSISIEQRDYSKIMLDRFKYYNLYKSTAIDHCARPLGIFDPWYDPSQYTSSSMWVLFSLVIAIIN